MSTDDSLGKALNSSDYIASTGRRSRDAHKSQKEIDQTRIRLLAEGISRLMFIYTASHKEILSAIEVLESGRMPKENPAIKNSWPNHVPDITNCVNNFNI